MRYLCLLIGEPGIEGPVPGTPEFAQMLSDYESATRAMAGDGALVDSGPLQPPSSAARPAGARCPFRTSDRGLIHHATGSSCLLVTRLLLHELPELFAAVM